MEGLHEICITKIAATISTLLGVDTHEGAAQPVSLVLEKAAEAFDGKTCDRVFMYNPDAVGAWIYEKYQSLFSKMEKQTDLKISMLSVMPSVTPVCFGSMYTGMDPSAHGIMEYVKPVLKVDTVFDDMIRAGKRAAIVSTAGDSISMIFLARQMDYFIYPTKEECNQKALELIVQDQHDLIVLYNGDYDEIMHYDTPEGEKALKALGENIATFQEIQRAITANWTSHNTVLSFAPDHGCHQTGESSGAHGTDQPCDMNIMHFYSFLQAQV